jgi:hypothetical protein
MEDKNMWKRSLISMLVMLSSISAFSQDSFRNGVFLDGKKNYVTIPNLDMLDSCRQFTIEFWMKTNNTNPCNLVNKWSQVLDTNAPSWWNRYNQGWSIDLNIEVSVNQLIFNSPLAGDTVVGAVRTMTTNSTYGIGGGSSASWAAGWDTIGNIPSDSWIHLAVSLDKNKSHMQCITYVNDRVGSGANGYGSQDSQDLNVSTPGCPLNLGGFASSIDSTLYFKGSFDELRIWNTLRNRQQIVSTLYDTLGSAYYASPDSGLIAYLRFDQVENLGVGGDGLTDDFRDLSIYGNHADIVGAQVLTELSVADSRNKYTGIEKSQALPASFDMFRNYPNPFNPSTLIRFSLPIAEHVRLKVFNALGVELGTLLDANLSKGDHEANWNAGSHPAGIYFCRLESEHQTKTIKMLLQK